MAVFNMLVRLSSGEDEASEHATFTSISHGFKLASSSTSKPKTSKQVARLWHVWLHLETTECSTWMVKRSEMSDFGTA